MNPVNSSQAQGAQSPKLSATTAGYTMAAAVAVLFNTALAWVKDSSPALNNFMKSLTGHHWTTHGLADLILFVVLGMIFSRSGMAEKMDAGRLITTLIVAVAVAALGLGLWFAFV